ncbi:MAG: 6-carboxytetrahydropterin synthase QueD [Chthonomonadales bacterium]|nr:6-carboxytetrahydropterin synthase QueD [Chthonomonadales bacterium]
MYTLIVKTTFEASHSIPGHEGKCARLHGHTYRVEAEFSGDELDRIGMLRDFSELRRALEEIVPDHTHLNDVLDVPTTAEHVARWIFDELAARELPVTAVAVWETDRYGCRYSRSTNPLPQGGA